MNRKELMEYLRTVCDAEDARYACDEAIAELQFKKEEVDDTLFLPGIDAPAEPKEVQTFSAFPFVIGGIVGVIAGGKLAYEISKHALSLLLLTIPIFALPVAMFGGGLLGFALNYVLNAASDKEENKRRSDDYNNKLELYNRQMRILRKCEEEDKEQRKAYIALLDKMIEENKKMKWEIEKKLDALYAMNIIYPNFRNLIAVHQILEYMEMGICDTLEGTDGAYKMYVEELRVKRICDSIQELKNAVVNAIEKNTMVQRHLLQQMYTVNENLVTLTSSVENGFGSIKKELETGYQNMLKMAQDSNWNADRLDEEMHSIEKSISEVRESLNASVHNQYVELRQKNISGYLLKHP